MKRLSAICSLIGKCEVFADIGCDHGYVSKYVLDNQLAKKVVAADISEKCLQKARNLLEGNEKIEFVCTDGLVGIDADLAVIAGLGGETIIEILSQKLLQANPASDLGKHCQTSFILQPQDHACELRLFLINNGYRITSDFLAKENDKFYDIIFAVRGEQMLDRFQLELGAFYESCSTVNRVLLEERLAKDYKKFCAYNDGGKNAQRRAFLKDALIRLGTPDKFVFGGTGKTNDEY